MSTSSPLVTRLDPAGYRHMPWKNGGGVSVDIANAAREGGGSADWGATIWRFGRTPIVVAAPFSDLTGYERLQSVVVGQGLVLETPDGEIDLRVPFKPVRYGGEVKIVTRLEAGPVEVVNLMADRTRASIDLIVLETGQRHDLQPGIHIVYAPVEAGQIRCAGADHALAADHALRLDAKEYLALEGLAGRLLVGSIYPL